MIYVMSWIGPGRARSDWIGSGRTYRVGSGRTNVRNDPLVHKPRFAHDKVSFSIGSLDHLGHNQETRTVTWVAGEEKGACPIEQNLEAITNLISNKRYK